MPTITPERSPASTSLASNFTSRQVLSYGSLPDMTWSSKAESRTVLEKIAGTSKLDAYAVIPYLWSLVEIETYTLPRAPTIRRLQPNDITPSGWQSNRTSCITTQSTRKVSKHYRNYSPIAHITRYCYCGTSAGATRREVLISRGMRIHSWSIMTECRQRTHSKFVHIRLSWVISG